MKEKSNTLSGISSQSIECGKHTAAFPSSLNVASYACDGFDEYVSGQMINAQQSDREKSRRSGARCGENAIHFIAGEPANLPEAF